MPYISKATPMISADPAVVQLIARWAVGAAGAVGAIEGSAVQSVTLNSTGQYTVVFKGRGPLDVLGFSLESLSGVADEDIAHQIESINETTRTVVVQFQDLAGAPANVGNGGAACLVLWVQNTTSSR